MANLTRFQIRGLFGNRDVDLDVSEKALVLVGPNGLGKSNAASIFYLFTTRQWARLLDHSFDSIIAHFGKDRHELTRADILGISEITDLFADRGRLPYRYHEYLTRLRDSGTIEPFLALERLPSVDRKNLTSILGMNSQSEFLRFQSFIRSRLGSDAGIQSPSRAAISELLADNSGRRTIYLPTYRRIEKELKQIFPDIEERIRSSEIHRRSIKSDEGKTYVDLVSFGMEDVKSAIDARLEYLRAYSLGQFNGLSGTYLRDVIRGKATDFQMSKIKKLGDKTLDDILDRVSESTLNKSDKSVLRERIQLIRRAGKKSSIDLNDQYLVHYFSRLMEVYDDIRAKEIDIASFVKICNKYLNPSKSMLFDDAKFSVEVKDQHGRSLELSHLSSGEKQIISLFAHLYLEGNEKNIIIIDEPELSLSVPWQKIFLLDIIESKRCEFLLAVTHSPFIYQNGLRELTKDFRSLVRSNG